MEARPKKIHTLDSKEDDRISLLPEELLHRILCSPSLSQKEAIQTCVLSKAWRYVGCTRPKIEWKKYYKSPAILDSILQAYNHRNIRLDEFSLSVSWEDNIAASTFLHKWIPMIVHNMSVKTLRLDTGWLALFELPSLILESDHIQNLSLQECVLKSSSSEPRLYLQRLQTLRLEEVHIPEEILDNILSNCTFLEDVSLKECKGFKRIKMFVNNNKPTKLARFSFCDDHDFVIDESAHGVVSIEIGDDDSQTQTSIDTTECKPLESAQNRRQLCLESARLLSYSCSCNFTILELYDVYIPKRILDNILSYCPLIKNVSLTYCKGFETIEMLNDTTSNLQHFCFNGNDDHRVSIEIGNNIKTLRSIDISHCLFSVSQNKRLKCARLKQLSLTRVQLMSSKSFSCKLHSLEKLKLDNCSGIEKFKLSSRSMKRLSIKCISMPFKATIDAPSMVSFKYEGILPQSISFAGTTSDHWKSNIILGSSVDGHDHCFNELYDLLKASSQSEISLELGMIDIRRLGTQLHIGDDSTTNDDDDIACVSDEAKHELPVAVEHLTIKRLAKKAHSSAVAFLNRLFHMFRPSFIYLIHSNKKHREITELLFKKRETVPSYFWQRDLEEVSLQVNYLHRNQSEWQPVEHTGFTELSNKGADIELKYRIHLKWRD